MPETRVRANGRTTTAVARRTAGRRPVRLVYQEAFQSMGKVLAREYVVKHLTRARKEALVVSSRRHHR